MKRYYVYYSDLKLTTDDAYTVPVVLASEAQAEIDRLRGLVRNISAAWFSGSSHADMHKLRDQVLSELGKAP